jgi:hypothetical protein
MEVCDLRDDRVGTIAHIYRYPAAGASGKGSPAASTAPPYEEVLEIKTGLLGSAPTCTFR